MQKNISISIIATIAIAIGAMMIPGENLAPAAFAYHHHHHHHHHHHGDKIENSGNVIQSIDQSNVIVASNSGDNGNANANDNTQVNDASNSADVHIHN